MRKIGSLLLVACVAASMATSASPAAGSVTVGQTGSPTGLCGPASGDWAQLTVSSGNSYVVPALPSVTALTIISWSHEAYTAAGQKLKFKVYHQVSGMTYRVVGQDTRDLTPAVLNTFQTSISVQAGDVLGITTPADSAGSTGCGFGASPETDARSAGTDAGPGEEVTFANFGADRLNISAQVEPTNTFSVGGRTLNKKKGTARLTVDVPNPGDLTVSGNGVRAAAALTVKSVPAAGPVALTIKARGKKLKKLSRKGKVKLALSITYTPTGGSPSTQETTVKLKKKIR
jgi:hypothetical protein